MVQVYLSCIFHVFLTLSFTQLLSVSLDILFVRISLIQVVKIKASQEDKPDVSPEIYTMKNLNFMI